MDKAISDGITYYKGHFDCRKDQGGEDGEPKPEQ